MTTLRLSLAIITLLGVYSTVQAQNAAETLLATNYPITSLNSELDSQLSFDADLPMVLSATRLRQPKADAPATVTVLQGELLQSLGITTLWDAFRLVPGMTLGYVESNVPVVSYHGTVANDQRRLQVLLDGRTMYNPMSTGTRSLSPLRISTGSRSPAAPTPQRMA